MMAGAQNSLRFHLGRTSEDGLAAAERALALDANLAEAHSAKARVLMQRVRFDESLAEIGIALRLDPDSFDANSAAGRWHYLQRRFAEAIAYYEKAWTGRDRIWPPASGELLPGDRRSRGCAPGGPAGARTHREDRRAGAGQRFGDELCGGRARRCWARPSARRSGPNARCCSIRKISICATTSVCTLVSELQELTRRSTCSNRL
jgi:tetratricopeptide (TPR) repeat protein